MDSSFRAAWRSCWLRTAREDRQSRRPICHSRIGRLLGANPETRVMTRHASDSIPAHRPHNFGDFVHSGKNLALSKPQLVGACDCYALCMFNGRTSTLPILWRQGQLAQDQ